MSRSSKCCPSAIMLYGSCSMTCTRLEFSTGTICSTSGAIAMPIGRIISTNLPRKISPAIRRNENRRLMLTLRQIEVIRAIMVTGTVGGAARLLNVSSPGVSRVMKHAETSVGVKLFSRKGGRYSPTPQANAIFSQINGVYDKVEDLQFVISRIQRGAETELKIGSVPSIANIMVPRAIADLRKALPNLLIEVDILKIEDAADYLLLGKGEVVALSYKLDHTMLA